jgi:hypothetical protein
MHRPRRSAPLALAACAAALAAGGAVTAAQGSAPAPTTAQTIALRIPLTHFKFLDNAKKGPSTGDRDIDYGAVVDARTGAHRGVLMQSCDFAKLGKRALSSCAGGVQLRAGEIDFALTGLERGRISTYAITGGTGAYATARGTVVFTPKAKGDTFKGIKVDFHVAP